MIKSLTLTNFQKHERLRIKFDQRICCIVGPTDRGKSAVLRALKWLCTNKPSGDEFVHHDADSAKVVLKLDDDRMIKRVRGKGINTYSLDGLLLKAFGADVPKSIAKLLNISEVTFQGQHDSTFWFGDPAGVVSRRLNAVIDLGTIDRTMDHLRAAARKADSKAEVVKEQAVEARKAFRAVKQGKIKARAFEAVRDAANEAKRCHAKADLLRSLIKEASEYTLTLKNAANGLEQVKEVEQIGTEYVKLLGQRFDLSVLIEDVEIETREVEEAQSDLNELQKEAKRLHTKLLTQGTRCPKCGQRIKKSLPS